MRRQPMEKLGESKCPKCGELSTFLYLAFWTDNDYKCPSCFSSVEIVEYPSPYIVFGHDYLSKSENKIAVLVLDGLYIAGVQKHCLFLAKCLKILGYDVLCIALEGGGIWADKFIDTADALVLCNNFYNLEWSNLDAMFSFLLQDRFEFVSSHLVKPVTWCVQNIPAKIPLFANLHSLPSEHEKISVGFLNEITNRSTKILFPSIDTLRAYKEQIRSVGLNYERMEVLKNHNMGEHSSDKVEKEKHSGIRIVVVSRLDADKFSISLFFDTISILMNENIEFQVLIAGSGELFTAIEERVNATCANTVKLLGFVLDVNKLYEWADVAFLPSKREGLPYVMLEAIDHGCNVVMPSFASDFIHPLVKRFSCEDAATAAELLKLSKDHKVVSRVKEDSESWVESVSKAYKVN